MLSVHMYNINLKIKMQKVKIKYNYVMITENYKHKEKDESEEGQDEFDGICCGTHKSNPKPHDPDPVILDVIETLTKLLFS